MQSDRLQQDAAPTLLAKGLGICHAVQFYENEEFLLDKVADYVSEGLRVGERVYAIVTRAHRDALLARIPESQQALATGQLTLVDAREMLASFVTDGMPDRDSFRNVLARLLTEDAPRRFGPTRLFGEMVDVLWREESSNAAIRLEELWNESVREYGFSLLCGYDIGRFRHAGDGESFMDVCRNHSHVLPTESYTQLDDSQSRLRQISRLQHRALALETELQKKEELEMALRNALAERTQAEQDLRASLEREQAARAKAEASDAFKEMFLGVLGHDLLNPLHTILTTARLMTMRQELPAASQTRIDRIVSSGTRMQRMIEQIHDMTRDRLAAGIPVAREREYELTPLVSKIVAEIRTVHPGHVVEFVSEGACKAKVDCDRFEQVVSNLLDNAVVHGDPEKPIRIALCSSTDQVYLSVHNYGSPIDPSLIPLLFDPFKYGRKARGGSAGLGLGLYISERIVGAHGGRIEVDSTRETGTRFGVILPVG